MKPATSGGCAAVPLAHTKVEAETQMCLGRQRQSIGWRAVAVYQTERQSKHIPVTWRTCTLEFFAETKITRIVPGFQLR